MWREQYWTLLTVSVNAMIPIARDICRCGIAQAFAVESGLPTDQVADSGELECAALRLVGRDSDQL
jgi:hypothetical protein